MPINCITIDDDPGSLESLHAYMDKLPKLQMIKSFTNPMKALMDISNSDEIDIIFMDIEMPELSGLELASRLRGKTKHLIFTTAHSKYAIDAFKVEADAYLLKPYSMLHFSEAINHLYPNEYINELLPVDDFFHIPLKDQEEHLVKIHYGDLVLLENTGDIIYFRTTENSYISVKLSFTNMLDQLKKHPAFIQVNPSAIVSKLHIKSVLGKKIVLSGGLSVALTQKYKESFLSFISQNLGKATLAG